jgi:MraZ protein
VLFLGNSEHNIDPKLRLAIPAKYRNMWDPAKHGGAWVSVAWPTGQIRLFTERSFERIVEQAVSGQTSLMPTAEQHAMQVSELGMAARLEMDSAGRIALPKKQIERTGLKQEVTIVGMGSRLEIWDRQAWDRKEDEVFAKAQDMADKLGRTQ